MKIFRIFLYFASCILHFTFFSSAQRYDPSKVKKKAIQLYNQALDRAGEGNLSLAADLFKKCIEADNKYVDAYLSLAGVYGQEKKYSICVEYYEKAFALDSDYTIEYKLPYSIDLAGLGKF